MRYFSAVIAISLSSSIFATTLARLEERGPEGMWTVLELYKNGEIYSIGYEEKKFDESENTTKSICTMASEVQDGFVVEQYIDSLEIGGALVTTGPARIFDNFEYIIKKTTGDEEIIFATKYTNRGPVYMKHKDNRAEQIINLMDKYFSWASTKCLEIRSKPWLTEF